MCRHGRFYVIDERSVELFPPRVMAEALERTSSCLVKWERAGKFPLPMYAVSASVARQIKTRETCLRYYSGEQVQNANALYRALGMKRNGGRWEQGGTTEKFLARLREVFYRVDGVYIDPETGEMKEAET